MLAVEKKEDLASGPPGQAEGSTTAAPAGAPTEPAADPLDEDEDAIEAPSLSDRPLTASDNTVEPSLLPCSHGLASFDPNVLDE